MWKGSVGGTRIIREKEGTGEDWNTPWRLLLSCLTMQSVVPSRIPLKPRVLNHHPRRRHRQNLVENGREPRARRGVNVTEGGNEVQIHECRCGLPLLAGRDECGQVSRELWEEASGLEAVQEWIYARDSWWILTWRYQLHLQYTGAQIWLFSPSSRQQVYLPSGPVHLSASGG